MPEQLPTPVTSPMNKQKISVESISDSSSSSSSNAMPTVPSTVNQSALVVANQTVPAATNQSIVLDQAVKLLLQSLTNQVSTPTTPTGRTFDASIHGVPPTPANNQNG